MRVLSRTLALLAWIALLPTAALAQAVIAGTVKDSSGAVLPGVTVEAASPALIERVRSAVTDGTGQYRIEELRPGTYSVTFSLTGFSGVKRDGIELTGSFTATVNADLKVGAVAETITVTGETPVVDVQSSRREVTINNDALKSIPTVRSYNAIVNVVPGVMTNLNDVVTTTSTTQFPIHGGRNNEGRMTVDGLNIGRIGEIFGKSRATIGRMVIDFRRKLLEETRRNLGALTGASEGDVLSLIRLLQSGLDVSIRGFLRRQEPPAG